MIRDQQCANDVLYGLQKVCQWFCVGVIGGGVVAFVGKYFGIW